MCFLWGLFWPGKRNETEKEPTGINPTFRKVKLYAETRGITKEDIIKYNKDKYIQLHENCILLDEIINEMKETITKISNEMNKTIETHNNSINLFFEINKKVFN